jgi:hypothetical protein
MIYAFITSYPHSGSTLLNMLINLRPDVCSLGELYSCYPLSKDIKDPEKFQCSCGLPLKQCGYWSSINEAVSDISNQICDFDDYRLMPKFSNIKYIDHLYNALWGPAWLEGLNDKLLPFLPFRKKWFAALVKRHEYLFDGVFSTTKTKCFVDSSKSPYLGKFFPYFHREHIVKIIHLFRDPIQVAASMKRNLGVLFDPACISENWISHEKEANRYFRYYQKNNAVHWVSYEQLSQEPEMTLKGVFEFLGLESGSINIDLLSKQQHIVGNTMRFLRNFDGIRVDDRWKNELTSNEIQIIRSTLENSTLTHTPYHEI